MNSCLFLTRLQKAGLLRSDPEPILQFSHALFSCTVYLSIPALYKSLLPGIDFSSPEVLKHAREFVVDFVVKGLLSYPGKGKAKKEIIYAETYLGNHAKRIHSTLSFSIRFSSG